MRLDVANDLDGIDPSEQTPADRYLDRQVVVGLLCIAATAIATALLTHHLVALIVVGLALALSYPFIPKRLWRSRPASLEVGAALFLVGLMFYYTWPAIQALTQTKH